MCTNDELNRSLGKVVSALEGTTKTLQATNVAVGRLEAQFSTWKETKCKAHEDAIKELQISERTTRERVIVTAVKMSLIVGFVGVAAAALATHLFAGGFSSG